MSKPTPSSKLLLDAAESTAAATFTLLSSPEFDDLDSARLDLEYALECVYSALEDRPILEDYGDTEPLDSVLDGAE